MTSSGAPGRPGLEGGEHGSGTRLNLKIWIYSNPLGPVDGSRPFRRGDSNADGGFDLTDAVGTLGHLFLGADEPVCLAAADSDDDGRIDIGDPIRLLGWPFLGGGPPAPPRECGIDPDGSVFDCRESPCPREEAASPPIGGQAFHKVQDRCIR